MDQSVGKKRIDPRGSANMSICIDAFAAPEAKVVYSRVYRQSVTSEFAQIAYRYLTLAIDVIRSKVQRD
jgi:hypothetical protein